MFYRTRIYPHTYTHTTVSRPSWILSGTTWVSRHQKGKTRKVKPIWIYWSKRYWMAVASAAPYANLQLDPDTTTPASHHSVFYRPHALPVTQPTASKYWRHRVYPMHTSKIRHLLLLSFRNIICRLENSSKLGAKYNANNWRIANNIEIRICISLTYDFYVWFCWPVSKKFHFLSEIPDTEWTTILSHMQNVMQLGKE